VDADSAEVSSGRSSINDENNFMSDLVSQKRPADKLRAPQATVNFIGLGVAAGAAGNTLRAKLEDY
jgi:hypothetical protein